MKMRQSGWVWASLAVWVVGIGCSSNDSNTRSDPTGQGGTSPATGGGAGLGGQVQGGASGSAGTGGTSSGASPEEACEGYLDAYCDVLEQCIPLELRFGFGDHATCVARQKPQCLSTLSLPQEGLTPDSLGTCTAALKAESCAELYAGLPTACEPAGGLANGSPCGNDFQCQSTECRFGSGTACGVCKSRQPVGGPCTAKSDCEHGLVCSTSKVCSVYKKAGETCDNDCQPGLGCFGPAASKKCALLPGAGETCDPNGVKAPADCAYDTIAVCDPTSHLCKVAKPAQKGEACGATAGGLMYCQASSCLNGTCQPFKADGEACGAGMTPCQKPATCTDGHCVLVDHVSCQ